MNADEYWARRSREREAEWFKKSQQTIEKELAAEYERSLQRLTQKVEALYGRFATENGLTMAEAVKLISGPEYKAWRMDIEDYVKQIGNTGDKGLLRELNTLSMRSRISRLDKLRGETLMELDKLGRKVDSSMTKFLSDAYADTKKQTLGDLAKQGISSLATEVSPERVKDVLKTPWSGKNYSERIWKNTTKLADTIQTEIVNGVHRGSSVQSMTKRVQERMGVGRSDSERLVRTEMNYVNNTAALDSMREAKMKYFRFIATIDRRTSAVCRDHDGNVYELDEASVGDNVPPLHARCRSTIAASLEGPERKTSESSSKKISLAANRNPIREEPEKNIKASVAKVEYASGVQNTSRKGKLTTDSAWSPHVEDACRKAREYGKRTGNEISYWIDAQGRDVISPVSGDSFSIVLPGGVLDILTAQPNRSVDCIHNHINSESFSYEDLVALASIKAIDNLYVIGHNGTKYRCSFAEGYQPSKAALKRLYQTQISKMGEVYIRLLNSGFNEDVVWMAITHRAMKNIAREWGWIYERIKA